MTCHFVLVTGKALEQLLDHRNDLVFLRKVLVGWDGVEAANGKPLEFSDKNLKVLEDIGYWKRAVVAAYMRWCNAVPAKNSDRPPADGLADGLA